MKLTNQYLYSKIDRIEYHQHPDTLSVTCALILHNNFVVTGTSNCILNEDDFSKRAVSQAAFENAIENFRRLESYRIKAENKPLEQTWQGRLLLEYRQMQTRTEKLHDFLSKNPNHEAATILREQYYAMRQYLTVLQERVAELDEKVREIPPQLPFEDLPEAERSYLQSEGYDYAFDGHSDFSDIPNAEFHRRRKAYLAAREHLAELIRGKDE